MKIEIKGEVKNLNSVYANRLIKAKKAKKAKQDESKESPKKQ